jgi:hypothetical protein
MALSPQLRRIIFMVISSIHVLCGVGLFITGLILANHDLYSYGPGVFATFEGLAGLVCFGWCVGRLCGGPFGELARLASDALYLLSTARSCALCLVGHCRLRLSAS